MILEKAQSDVSDSLDRRELASQFARDGYTVIRGLFRPDEVDTIRETFTAAAANGPIEGVSDAGLKGLDPSDPLAFYPRMLHPHRHPDLPLGRLSLQYLLDRRIYDVLCTIMGEEPVGAQSMFYFKPAGARGQELHQDNFYLRVSPGTCYAAWIAVDPSDAENGGMMVVPGSHETDVVCPQKADMTKSFSDAKVPVPEGMRAELVPLQAGDVLFFNGSLIHGSYPNTSADRFRRSLIFHYVPKASEEMANWYSKLTFDGGEVEIAPAIGGGPCGAPMELMLH